MATETVSIPRAEYDALRQLRSAAQANGDIPAPCWLRVLVSEYRRLHDELEREDEDPDATEEMIWRNLALADAVERLAVAEDDRLVETRQVFPNDDIPF